MVLISRRVIETLFIFAAEYVFICGQRYEIIIKIGNKLRSLILIKSYGSNVKTNGNDSGI